MAQKVENLPANAGDTKVEKKLESESCLVVSDFLRSNGLYGPWNSLGQNTGMGIRSLLQGISPTQGSRLMPNLYIIKKQK